MARLVGKGSMRKLKFGACIFAQQPLPEVVRIAQLAEELGYDSLWIADSQVLCRELYVTLTACALGTSRIKLGAGVTAPYTRHVSVTASAFASLNELAPGRVILGVSTGNSLVRTIGRRPARIAEMEEYVGKLTDLLDNRDTDFDGGVRGGISWLDSPTQIPIYVAGTGPKMLKAATKMTSNIILMAGSGPAFLQEGLEKTYAGMGEAGKDIAEAEVIMWVPFAIAKEGDVAREHVSKHVASLLSRVNPDLFEEEDREAIERIKKGFSPYPHDPNAPKNAGGVPDKFIDQLALAGNPDEVRAQVERMATVSGFDTVVLNTQASNGKFTSLEESLKLFADNVIAPLS